MKGFDDPEIYRKVLQGLTAGVYLVDLEQHVVFWNDGAAEITGHLSQEMLGRKCDGHMLEHMDRENNVLSGATAPVGMVMREGKPFETQLSIRHRAGYPVLVRLRAMPIRDGSGQIVGAAECFEQAGTSLHFNHRASKLAELGCTDQTTGALTHEFTRTQIRERMETFVLHRVPFSVLAIKVDHIDELRARDGSGAVTAVMKVVAQTLANSLRPTDLLGRWTETTFLAIATECNVWEVIKVGDRLRRMVHCAEATWWGDHIRMTASMGGAGAKEEDSAETIVDRAQAALEESILQGGDRVIVHQD
jgi:diguanylate cyclase (GGDEF)-like protein/PAS domain S-box-containing protein